VAAKGYKCDNGGERNKKQLGSEGEGQKKQGQGSSEGEDREE
jgi:hypothetical protein